MRLRLLSLSILAVTLMPMHLSADAGAEFRLSKPRPLLLAQAYDCSPRRTCPQINSCEEANWYLQNCPWGGRLDRDKDGIPCESIC